MSKSRTRRSRSRRTAGTPAASALAAAVSRRLAEALRNEPVAELARAAACSPGTVRRYLSGQGVPTVAFVIAVCVAYGLSVQWLLTGKGTMRRLGRPGPS